MGKGGEGGGNGHTVGPLYFLTSIGIAGYETWPDFKKEGYLSPKAWEQFAINFTTTYAETEEGSGMGELARLSALKAVLQTMPDIQQQTKDKKFDSPVFCIVSRIIQVPILLSTALAIAMSSQRLAIRGISW